MRLLGFLFVSIHLLCLGVVWCSLWPGLLAAVWVTSLFIGIPLVIAGAGAVVLWRWQSTTAEIRWRGRSRSWPYRLILATLITLLATQLLIEAEIPRQLAFRLSRPAFEAARVSAPVTDSFEGVSLNRRLGLYRVPAYGADAGGGVYFMTGSYGLIWTSTYGIAYRPNSEGVFFGDQGYAYYPLAQDWYWFKVSYGW